MQKLSRIELERVEYIPKTLEPGVLYVAEEFGAAVHLCACGCGSKVSTPLSPVGWRLEESAGGVTLMPSVGNWQLPCRSHYVIRAGRIVWAGDWSPEQVNAGRRAEERRRHQYYSQRARKGGGVLARLWGWIKSFWE